jgi:hypothetical protein
MRLLFHIKNTMRVPKRIALIGIGFLTLAGLSLAFAWPSIRFKAQVAHTRTTLDLVAAAARSYFTNYGVWPQKLAQLTTTNNPKGLVFLLVQNSEVTDGWGRQITLKPYDPAIHSGAVQARAFDRQGQAFTYEVRFP